MSRTVDDRFLAAQQDYYRARAPEYDEWWERRGRYDHGPAENAAWFAEQEEVRGALECLDLRGQVLELACGTGAWTVELLKSADRITAVDGSPEMLALNRLRLGDDPRVRYQQADLFSWEPDAAYHGAFFGFWLSHVPPERLTPFLRTVRCALKPEGRVFFVDSRRDPVTTAPNQPLPPEGELLQTRRLNDGRAFDIVKRYYEPTELVEAFAEAGMTAEVWTTPRFFIHGVARAYLERSKR